MDDLLKEFLTETTESLDLADTELVRFEAEPNNKEILSNIFRLVHTIKGTCGFIGLPRLAALAHAAETLMDKFREGTPVTGDAVELVLQTIDRIKVVLRAIEAQGGKEPPGSDADLIEQLEALAAGKAVPAAAAVATIVAQSLERPLFPGEVARGSRARLPRDGRRSAGGRQAGPPRRGRQHRRARPGVGERADGEGGDRHRRSGPRPCQRRLAVDPRER